MVSIWQFICKVFQHNVLHFLLVKVGPQVQIGDDVIIKADSKIFANVEKPSMIKENVVVEAGATLEKEIMIGAKAMIFAGATVKAGANVPDGRHVAAGETFPSPDDYLFEKECDADNKCVFQHGIAITEIQSVATSDIIHLPQINIRNDQPLPITIHCHSKCKLKGRKLPFDFSKIIFEGPTEGNFNNRHIIKMVGNEITVSNE